MKHVLTHKIVQTIAPASEPVLLQEMKDHLRLVTEADDTLIQSLITASRQYAEIFTKQALITQTFSVFLDKWDEPKIMLSSSPLLSVTEIRIYDENGDYVLEDLSNYVVDTVAPVGAIIIKHTPPVSGKMINGIEIRYKAGYGDNSSDVPMSIRQGIKQLCAYLYEHRGDVSEDKNPVCASGAEVLWAPYRIIRGV